MRAEALNIFLLSCCILSINGQILKLSSINFQKEVLNSKVLMRCLVVFDGLEIGFRRIFFSELRTL